MFGELMMRGAFWLLTLLVIGIAGVRAQDWELTSNDSPYPCSYTNGTSYQRQLFPRYDVAIHSLELIDPTTNTAVRTPDTFDKNVRIINWSPDCRYLTGALGEIRYADKQYVSWFSKDIVFWDAINGGQVQAFPNPGRYLDYVHQTAVLWSPGGDYALILGGCEEVQWDCVHERARYDFLWQRETNTSVRVGRLPMVQPETFGQQTYYRYYPVENRAWFNQSFWDSARGWLWGSAEGGVSAYDVTTGAEVAFFRNNSWEESRFVFSPDGIKVVVYTISEWGGAGEGALRECL
jgi:hypothetical protein